MIEFSLNTEIQCPIQEVVRKFTDRSLFPLWQPGLVSSEKITDTSKRQYKLVFQFGRRKMIMTETIEQDQLPEEYICSYEMKGIFNRVQHRFEDSGHGTTRWKCTHEFRFKGVMNLVVRFMYVDFHKQSQIIMNNFKRFAEQGAQV